MFTDELLEKCAEAVHQAYCNYHLKNKGEEYWTKGDYSLLDESTKQIDRETVKAVFKVLKKAGWVEKYNISIHGEINMNRSQSFETTHQDSKSAVQRMLGAECENDGKYPSKRFINHFVPVICLMREKDEKNLLPSMNKCLTMLSKALQEYCT